MNSPAKKFRVGVVTILEVDAVNFSDAANVAESAVKRALLAADAVDEAWYDRPVVIRWEHSNRHFYEATVTQMPLELSRTLLNRHVTIGVDQPTEDDNVPDPIRGKDR